MPTEFELHKAVKAADEAKAILENPKIKDAFDKLKQTYLDQLMSTNVLQADVREKCWMAARVVDVVRDHFSTIINSGTLARYDLEQLATDGQRKKTFGII